MEISAYPITVQPITVHSVGEPTTTIGIGGLRLVTAPSFDPPGEHPDERPRHLLRTEPAAVAPDAVGPIDAVLLSHDQHPDKLDDMGRTVLGPVDTVITTGEGAERPGGAAPLPGWQHIDLPPPRGVRPVADGTARS